MSHSHEGHPPVDAAAESGAPEWQDWREKTKWGEVEEFLKEIVNIFIPVEDFFDIIDEATKGIKSRTDGIKAGLRRQQTEWEDVVLNEL
jgi:hypothetical protein